MKKLSKRSAFAAVLALVLLAGTFLLILDYALHAQEWVRFSGSPHVYAGSNLSVGQVTDRNGTVLLQAEGERQYAQDELTRKSTLHLVGDREGAIYAPYLGHFADRLMGYNKINGLYSIRQEMPTARLSISAAAQNEALSALAGRAGTAAVYNYKTGELLCAVTSPTYDPDNVPDIENNAAYSGAYVNRFFDALYTPGSIWKLVTTAAALEQMDDVQEKHYPCEGKTVIGGQNVICEGVHGNPGLKEGLASSCNCFYGRLAVDVGAKTLMAYADKLGLTQRLECDGNKSAEGRFDLRGANDGDLAWAGIGQYTDQVTAYAFLRFMGVVGGRGEAAEPYLMDSIRAKGRQTYQAEARSTGRLLKPETCETLAKLMRNSVETVYGAQQFGSLRVCAKSGTAELEGQQANAMFAGFVDDAQYPLAFVVFVEQGGHGSVAAAPIAARVLSVCAKEIQNNLETP